MSHRTLGRSDQVELGEAASARPDGEVRDGEKRLRMRATSHFSSPWEGR